MKPERAMEIVQRYHNTEKTFPMVETDGKLCFIVSRSASKKEIAEAIEALYEKKPVKINTMTTLGGKKAFVKFENADIASDLASEIGML